MIASWMAYGTIVGSMLAGTAFCLERALPRRVPRRSIWAGALAGLIVIPLIEPVGLASGAAGMGAGTVSGGVGQMLIVEGGPAGVAGGARAAGSALDPLLLGVWIAMSGALLVFGLASLLRLRREMRSWKEAEVDGHRVRLAPAAGPAVTGLLRGVIVLPTWALGIPQAERDAMLRHEAEHVRQRDPVLLNLAYLLLIALPWNLPLWWMVHRLRLAVEFDCDARVVGAGTDPWLYGDLLLRVAARKGRLGGAAVVLFGHPTFLERRIRRLMKGSSGGRVLPFVAALGAASLVLLACEMETPVQTSPAPAIAAPSELERADLSAEPVFTPFEVAPQLLDRGGLARAIELAYPADLRDAGIGGQVILWVFSDEDGIVRETRVARSSGYPQLDEAARTAIQEARFRPAINQGEPAAVWIQIPLTFSAAQAHGDSAARAPSEAAPPPPRQPDAIPFEIPGPAPMPPSPGPEPTFTPFEERPELLNRSAFAAALQAHYPSALRDAGVEGTTILWVMLDDEGMVASTRVAATSGHDALDEAAARALREANFKPARREGRPVTVWIQMPVSFRAR